MGRYSDVEPLLISRKFAKFPALWKATDQNYKNVAVKENAWCEEVEAVNRYNDFFNNIGPTRERRWSNLPGVIRKYF